MLCTTRESWTPPPKWLNCVEWGVKLYSIHPSIHWVVNKPLRLSFACELTRRSVRAKRGSQFIVCLCTVQCAMRFRLVDFVLQSISRCSLCVASRAIRCSIAVVLVKWAKRRTSKWACTVFQKETQLFLLTSANVHRLLLILHFTDSWGNCYA